MHPATFRKFARASSWLFLLGVILIVAGYVVDSTGFVLVAWGIVGTSALAEIVIDSSLKDTRPARHGRYGRQGVWMNGLQSLVFLAGVGAQMYAEVGRSDDQYPEWQVKAAIAWAILSLSGLLAVFSVGCCCSCCNRSSDDEVGGRFMATQFGAGLYFGGSIAITLGVFDSCDTCFAGHVIILAGLISHLTAGILWIVADAALPREETAKAPAVEIPHGGQTR